MWVRFMSKLKNVKGYLKEWNKHVFGLRRKMHEAENEGKVG